MGVSRVPTAVSSPLGGAFAVLLPANKGLLGLLQCRLGNGQFNGKSRFLKVTTRSVAFLQQDKLFNLKKKKSAVKENKPHSLENKMRQMVGELSRMPV